MTLSSEFSRGRLHPFSAARDFEVHTGSKARSLVTPAGETRGLRFVKGLFAALVLSLAFWVPLLVIAVRFGRS